MEDGEVIVECRGVEPRVDGGLAHGQAPLPPPHLHRQHLGRGGAGGRRQDGGGPQDCSSTVMRAGSRVYQSH